MKIKRSILAPVVVALIALATGGWFLQQGTSEERNVYMQAQLFEQVLHHIADRYVEEMDPSTLYRMAIEGMMQRLGDPHSVFMTPEEYAQLRIQTEGEYGGLGIQIDVRDGWLTVIAPLAGTPADRAGLQAGDRIVRVDGGSTRGWSTQKAVTELRGPKGEPVILDIARVGFDQTIPYRIVRDEIHVKSIPSAFLMDDGIGYIELTVFSETSTEELTAAINQLEAQGMRGLILDLRRNPGGLLEQAITISDLFLDRGAVVSETRSRLAYQNQEYTAVDGDHYADLPLVVLVGPRSASASEILAGALQDHDRALIIGETSFGKGSVQTLFPLPGGNFLKLTTAKWFTPAGRSIQRPYTEEDEVMVAGVGEEGQSTAAAEAEGVQDGAAAEEHDVYLTDGGRKVYGGGGIRPDLVVHDTLTTAEQAFIKAVQSDLPQVLDVLYRTSIAYAHDHPTLEPGFPVTDELLNRFHGELRTSGIDVDRSVYAGAERWVGSRLASEISRAKWGEEGATRRSNMQDKQVGIASDLLRQAPTPSALFGLAERRADASGTFLGLPQSSQAQEAGASANRP